MNRLIHGLLSAGTAIIMLSSCGDHSTAGIDRSLDTADAYLADGNLSDARNTADAVYSGDSASMSARQMGRLSLVYMQISDRSDDPTTVGQAINCYRLAYRAGADSAAAFYSALPVELDPYGLMLAEIVKQLDSPREIPADEPADTITASTH